jgi:ribonuclease HII
MQGMRDAIYKLGTKLTTAQLHSDVRIIIDGSNNPYDIAPDWGLVRVEPKADGKYAAVSAASVIAKVRRDEEMTLAAQKYPGYGFEGHKGYPTPFHKQRLEALGPCAIHRRSAAPVRALLEKNAKATS